MYLVYVRNYCIWKCISTLLWNILYTVTRTYIHGKHDCFAFECLVLSAAWNFFPVFHGLGVFKRKIYTEATRSIQPGQLLAEKLVRLFCLEFSMAVLGSFSRSDMDRRSWHQGFQFQLCWRPKPSERPGPRCLSSGRFWRCWTGPSCLAETQMDLMVNGWPNHFLQVVVLLTLFWENWIAMSFYDTKCFLNQPGPLSFFVHVHNPCQKPCFRFQFHDVSCLIMFNSLKIWWRLKAALALHDLGPQGAWQCLASLLTAAAGVRPAATWFEDDEKQTGEEMMVKKPCQITRSWEQNLGCVGCEMFFFFWLVYQQRPRSWLRNGEALQWLRGTALEGCNEALKAQEHRHHQLHEMLGELETWQILRLSSRDFQHGDLYKILNILIQSVRICYYI